MPADARLLLIEPDLYGLAGGLTVRFLEDEALAVSARALATSLGDLILLPDVSWRVMDGHELAAQLQLYEGDSGSIGEQYDHNDQLIVRYTSTF